jgi:type IV pilus assembly protein PilE
MKGFSLLEILVTFMLICILAAVVTPSYIKNINQAQRAKASLQVMKISAELENYYTTQHTYKNANLTRLNCGDLSSDKHYHFRLEKLNDTQYLIKAESYLPDPLCRYLSLDERGEKGYSGLGSKEQCWGTS